MALPLRATGPAASARSRLVVAVVTDGFSLLSLAAFSAPLGRGAGFELCLASARGGSVVSSTGLNLQTQEAAAIGPARVVAIFGGETYAPDLPEWIAAQGAMGAMVCGIGTGVGDLAAAGLLLGRRFSLAHSQRPAFAALWPGLAPAPERFCIDGPVASCPDGTLVADMALDLAAAASGPEARRQAIRASGIACRPGALPPVPPQTCPTLRRALAYIHRHLGQPDVLDACMRALPLSRRHLERLFQAQIGVSPSQHVVNLRLEQAHRLMCETDLSVAEVARQSGFNSALQFSRRFTRAFGCSPSQFQP